LRRLPIMTSNTKLSSISIAAIALLAASAPCFAQTKSAEIREDASNVVAMAGPELAMTSSSPKLTTAELRHGLLNAGPKSANEVAPSAKPRSLSPAAFKMSTGQFSAVENQRVFGQKTTIYEMDLGNSKKQFRADDDSYGVDYQNKRVSFVPSLGQRLPTNY
jgi:hypothetical protein